MHSSHLELAAAELDLVHGRVVRPDVTSDVLLDLGLQPADGGACRAALGSGPLAPVALAAAVPGAVAVTEHPQVIESAVV